MRAALFGTAIAMLGLAASSQAAQAQSPYDYPWCIYYMGNRGGGTSCYFASYEQCMASARGNGAYCAPNPQYRGGGRGGRGGGWGGGGWDGGGWDGDEGPPRHGKKSRRHRRVD